MSDEVLERIIAEIIELRRRVKELETAEQAGKFKTLTLTGNGSIGGDLTVSGAFKSRKNSTDYTGYIYVPLSTPLTSTSWDGDNKTSSNNGTIDLSSVFGVPAGIKAVKLSVQLQCNTAGKYANFGINSTYNYMLGQIIQVANAKIVMQGDVNCDSNGDIYFATDAATGSEMSVYVRIWGYYI